MEYTSTLFVNFLKKLIAFDKDCRAVIDVSVNRERQRDDAEKSEWGKLRKIAEQNANGYANRCKELFSDFQRRVEAVLSDNIVTKEEEFARLKKCKDILAIVSSSENSIVSEEVIDRAKVSERYRGHISLEQLLSQEIDFHGLASEINELARQSEIREAAGKYAEFYSICRETERVIEKEVHQLRRYLSSDIDELRGEYSASSRSFQQGFASEWQKFYRELGGRTEEFIEQWAVGRSATVASYATISKDKNETLNKRIEKFHAEFPPQQFLDEYVRIYSLEPSFTNYSCCSDMPSNVHIATLEYDISSLALSEYTKRFLDRYYPFMYRGSKLCIPYCATFNSEFSYVFQYNESERHIAVKNACDLGMRLFMMIPPGKLNFTFLDPVRLGESFAIFRRLVSDDDRTNEVINGQIWSNPADVENKLKTMTDHISNITQRCLQGKYDNIYEYNVVAEQNAEAYQVIMLMDFPANLTDQALKYLEQIATSGPKCGVFTIIYRNENHYQKAQDRSRPLIENVETHFRKFSYSKNGTEILDNASVVKGNICRWKGVEMPTADCLDTIISTLKKGIKTADKVVIGIEKVNDIDRSSNEVSDNTKNGIRIPIGLHGAKEVQYLSLGAGGSHHALIAGVAGSGKSSLLHTIILRALQQYSPDELVIYLVDFKRGVEFKIYADFELPSFKVIAIESEREFGYNILMAIEREQKIRADKFKKNHVDKIEEYRELGKKMPRVLVIMDEFHELFSSSNDEFGKKSAQIMERIVRQGRAFGVHMILASQSYSNISGIDRAVFDQMAVRIVLKCSKADANLLLDNGSTEVDLISIDDPGRAIYNSEAGNKEYNSHFRVGYIQPENHRAMLQKISDDTASYADKPTRILLSNIEDNKYSIFNQFPSYTPNRCSVPGRIYIGEPLSVTNDMNIDLTRSANSNLLLLGHDTEKARSMFAFAILSLCINYRVKFGRAPEQPFIYILNSKPLDDSYFKDTPQIIASELLPEYVQYIHCGDEETVQEVLSELHDNLRGTTPLAETDKYFFVFGYQRAEELKSEIKLSQGDDIDSLFNLMPSHSSKPQLSPKEIFHLIVKDGPKRGVHAILWQDSYTALEQDDNNIMSYFNLKVAFDMSPEEFSRSVGANDISLMSENNAIYYNKARDNQKFRPYQAPDEDWLNDISAKLH